MDITINSVRDAINCEDIWGAIRPSVDTVKLSYKGFIKKYHPDVYTAIDTTDLISKLNGLYELALKKLQDGSWGAKDVVILHNSASGKRYSFSFRKLHEFELGKLYIGNSHVVYIFDADKKKYIDNALDRLRNLTYFNAEMEKEFRRVLPDIDSHYTLEDGRHCLVLRKPKGVYLLQDFSDFYTRTHRVLEPEHIAWILNRLNNMTCLLQYNKLVHNGLSLSNLFISPTEHSIYFLGGWWYCVPNGSRLLGTQRIVFDLMPLKEKSEKKATYQTDIECIKYVGRELGNNLPDSMAAWLESVSGVDANAEYKGWNDVLVGLYGKRRFVPLNINDSDIYN